MPPTNAPNEDIGYTDTGRVEDKSLDEVSGCVASRVNEGILWIHNDGDDNTLSAIRTSGETVARLELPVRTDDVEDVAITPKTNDRPASLYLADVGDNKRKRDRVRIFRTPEPVLDLDRASKHQTIHCASLEVFAVSYPDRK